MIDERVLFKCLALNQNHIFTIIFLNYYDVVVLFVNVFLELLSSDILIVKILESQKPNNLEVFGGKESKGSHMGPHYDTHLVLTSSLFTSSRTLINLLTLVVNLKGLALDLS
jgi:hypothetical protein